MQCSKCEIQMEKGTLAYNGANWIKVPDKRPWWMVSVLKMKYVYAWRCSNCNRLEFTAEDT